MQVAKTEQHADLGADLERLAGDDDDADRLLEGVAKIRVDRRPRFSSAKCDSRPTV